MQYTPAMTETSLLWIVHILVQIALVGRILLRPNREPASRVAWVVVVTAVPLLGIFAYLLLGETNIGRRNFKAMRAALGQAASTLPPEGAQSLVDSGPPLPERYALLFRVGRSISGMPPVAGNTAELMADSNAMIAHLVADIDAAVEQVDVLFYIWLTDSNGSLVSAALQRAVARGVRCHAMVDGLGSRVLLKSRQWREMKAAGVLTAVALPVGNLLLRPLAGRVDLRNHRKISVIDGGVTYCGSQNCADPEFRVKARYAPWVDAVVRFEGPVARQNQSLFAADWMTYTGQDIHLNAETASAAAGQVIAQVIATGPGMRHSAMPEIFESLIYSAREELVISTPYYVPNQSMQAALCAAAHRGVKTILILPARNDSREVAAASRSYYASLLEAGVELREYVGGLLHSKTLTLDGELALIGSANMDRRSFELNFENNILLYDAATTAALRQRQQAYIDSSTLISLEEVASWSMGRRLWNNTVAMLGPVL